MKVDTTYKSIWRVAIPVIGGSIAQTIINITDTAFLGRLGMKTLGAEAIGGIFYFIFVMLAFGLAIGSQIIIARRTGEGNKREVGKVFDQSLYILGLSGIFLFILMKVVAPYFLKWVLKSDDIFQESMYYLSYRSYGIVIASLNMAFRSLFVGLSKTKVITYTTVMMALVNIILDYCLIFGNFGFPQMGIAGAAIASVAAELTALIFFIGFTLYKLDIKLFNLFKFKKWNGEVTKRIWILAYPSVFQNFIAISSWFMYFVIIEQIGEQELAISNIIRKILILMMLPVWGFATTANTMISNILGQGRSGEVLFLARRIILLSFIFIGLFLPIMLFKPEWLIMLLTDDAVLQAKSIYPLYVIFISLFIFVPGVIFIHSLSGTGDTRTAFIIEVIGIAAYLTFAYLTAMVFRLSLEFIWMSEMFYWGSIALLAYLRLRSGKWKKIKV